MRHAQLAWLGLLGGLTAAAAVTDIVWREQGRHASWTPPSLVPGVWGSSHPGHGGWQDDKNATPSVHTLQTEHFRKQPEATYVTHWHTAQVDQFNTMGYAIVGDCG